MFKNQQLSSFHGLYFTGIKKSGATVKLELCSVSDVLEVITFQFTLHHYVLFLCEGGCSALPCRQSLRTSLQPVSAHVTKSKQNNIFIFILLLCATAQIFNSARDPDMETERLVHLLYLSCFFQMTCSRFKVCRSLSFSVKKFIFNITHLFIHFTYPVKAPFPVTLAPSLCINENEAYYKARAVLIWFFTEVCLMISQIGHSVSPPTCGTMRWLV